MPAHLIVEEGPLAGLILEFKDKDEWIIGRDPDLADLVIEDSTASREHILCQKTDDGIVVKNLSTINPTLVNDQIISDPILLNEGDRIKIGQNTFLFSEEELDTEKGKTFFDEASEDEKDPFDAIFQDIEEEAPPPPKKPKKKTTKKTTRAKKEEKKEPVEEDEGINPYDTIFEDSDDDGELPLNLIGESPLILKVLSGPNAGAEIGIEKSHSYIIGKDPNSCDIVFQDLSVSRNHARLTVEADGSCFLEDLDSKNGTTINNKKLEDKQELHSQDMISVGTTSILLIDRESALETIYSPQVLAPPTEEEAKAKEAKERKKENWKKEPIPTRLLLMGSAFVMIVFMVFLSFFSLLKDEPLEVAERDHSKDVESILKTYPGLVHTYNPSTEMLFISGHLLTPIQEQELLYTLNQLDYISDIDNTIVIDEYIWSNMNDLISANDKWRSVRVTSNAPGEFVLSGYIDTLQDSEELADFVHLNFPYTDKLKNEVIVEQLLNTEVQGLLQQQGFSGVSFQITNGELILTGSYPSNKEKDLNSLISQFEDSPGIASVRNLSIKSTPQSARIDLSQNYQVTGISTVDDKPFSVVINGKILTEGESLDGMEITDLEPDLVLLQRGALKYKIEYSL